MPIKYKVCRVCKINKPREDFDPIGKSHGNDLKPRCRVCIEESIKNKKRVKPIGEHEYDSRRREGNTYITTQGYKAVKKNGIYILEHRLVMESILGRELRTEEQIHHIDGDKLNNKSENLEVILNGQHQSKHTKSETKQAISARLRTRRWRERNKANQTKENN